MLGAFLPMTMTRAYPRDLAELVRSTSPTVATYAKNDGVHVRVADKATTEAEADEQGAAAVAAAKV